MRSALAAGLQQTLVHFQTTSQESQSRLAMDLAGPLLSMESSSGLDWRLQYNLVVCFPTLCEVRDDGHEACTAGIAFVASICRWDTTLSPQLARVFASRLPMYASWHVTARPLCTQSPGAAICQGALILKKALARKLVPSVNGEREPLPLCSYASTLCGSAGLEITLCLRRLICVVKPLCYGSMPGIPSKSWLVYVYFTPRHLVPRHTFTHSPLRDREFHWPDCQPGL